MFHLSWVWPSASGVSSLGSVPALQVAWSRDPEVYSCLGFVSSRSIWLCSVCPFYLFLSSFLIRLLLRRLLFLIRPRNPRSLRMTWSLWPLSPPRMVALLFFLLSQLSFPSSSSFQISLFRLFLTRHRLLIIKSLPVLFSPKWSLQSFDDSTVSKLCTTLIKSHKLNVCDNEMYCIVNVFCSRTSWPVSLF